MQEVALQVFVFQHRDFANAVFSSKERAELWIKRHALTGLLTRYDVDEPSIEKLGGTGTLPKRLQTAFDEESITTRDVELFVDGSHHWHYEGGKGTDGDSA